MGLFFILFLDIVLFLEEEGKNPNGSSLDSFIEKIFY